MSCSSSSSSSPVAPSSRSWSVSDESLRRYVEFASESCIQELLSASMMSKSSSSMNKKKLDDDDDEESCSSWKLVISRHINNNGSSVEISKRRRRRCSSSHYCSSSTHMFRSRWVLNSVSPHHFFPLASALHAAKEWETDLVEGRSIKELEDNLSIIHLHFGQNSKPFFRNREFIVYERRETMEDGTYVVAVASLPKEIAAGVHPKQNNTIRGVILVSGWVVEKFDDHSCSVTYVLQLDPGAGWVPNFFLNRLNTKLVMIVIDNQLRKLVQPATSPPPPHHPSSLY